MAHYFSLFSFFTTTATPVHHIAFDSTNYQNNQYKKTPNCNTYPAYSFSYLPSVKQCKQLSRQEIIDCLLRECGGNIRDFQKQVLKLYPYYKSNNFIAVVKRFPEYATFVCATAKRMGRNVLFKMRMKWHGVKDVFYRLEQEVITQQALEQKAAPSKRVIESQKSVLRALQQEYLLQPCRSKLLQQKRQQRAAVLNDHFSGNDVYQEQTYTVSTQARQLLARSKVQIPQKLICIGNGVQQNAYKECIDFINRVARRKNIKTITNLDQFILELSALGLQSSSSGLIAQTYAITDVCWAVLDHCKAAGEGVGDGCVNVVDMITHPIDTVTGTLHGLYEVGSFLGKLLYEVGDIAVTGFYDADRANKKSDQFVDNICAVADAIVEKIKNTPSREYVKTISCFLTEGVLCTRALQASQKLYRTSKTHALRYINNPSSKVMVTTAEGIELQITTHASEVVLEKSGIQKFAKNKKGVAGARPKVITAYKTKDFLRETDLGKKLNDFCIDINRQYQNMDIHQIIKRIKIDGIIYHKGDCFYVDRFHRDHLEFFCKNGDFCKVINLDGSFNAKKSEAAERAGRTIRNIIK